MKEIIKESCVETPDEALNAAKNGANRLELCSRLDLDGLTPDEDLVNEVISSVDIPVKLMIRPRAGNFVYNAIEIVSMIEQIDLYKKYDHAGFVLGALQENNEIDLKNTEKLCARAYPFKVCFHKAIDHCPDPLEAIAKLKRINNLNAVLTSGKAPTAFGGMSMLKEMLKLQDENFNIIVAGKVSKNNLMELHQILDAREYHGRRIV